MRYAKIGRYRIYEDGRVFMIGIHQFNFQTRKHEPRELKRPIAGGGYEQVSLKIGNTVKTYYVHRLVAKFFIPNPLNKNQVNHKDGNKLNNTVENLEWCTQYENLKHADEVLGKIKLKLNPDQIREIWYKSKLNGVRNKDLAEEYGVSQSRISSIIKRTKESVDKYI